MKTKKPRCGQHQGFEDGMDLRACSTFEATRLPSQCQPDFRAAEWLAVRAGVAVATARVFAELNQWGHA